MSVSGLWRYHIPALIRVFPPGALPETVYPGPSLLGRLVLNKFRPHGPYFVLRDDVVSPLIVRLALPNSQSHLCFHLP